MKVLLTGLDKSTPFVGTSVVVTGTRAPGPTGTEGGTCPLAK